MNTILSQLSGEMAELVQQARRAVVRVSNGPGSAGAGTVWSSEGLIVTNAHVVHHDTPRVTLPGGQVLPAQVLAYDAGLDLALLSVRARGLVHLDLREAGDLQPGEWVFAIGHPWGVAGAVTAGVVIGGGPAMPDLRGATPVRSGRAPAQPRDWLMVSLVLRPGNSGGPLVDVHGRLVGVNTIMTGPAVGGAVPVHVVKQFLAEATRA